MYGTHYLILAFLYIIRKQLKNIWQIKLGFLYKVFLKSVPPFLTVLINRIIQKFPYVSLASLTYVNGVKFGAVAFDIICTFKKRF